MKEKDNGLHTTQSIKTENVRLLTERSSEFFGIDLFSVVSMQRMNLEVSRDSIDLNAI
jgi:hypothetical protein